MAQSDRDDQTQLFHNLFEVAPLVVVYSQTNLNCYNLFYQKLIDAEKILESLNKLLDPEVVLHNSESMASLIRPCIRMTTLVSII